MGEDAEAVQELKPYLYLIRDAIQKGWDQYFRDYGKFSHVHEIRTKACIIRDHIVDNVKSTFEDVQHVKLIERRSLFLLKIKNYAIRFKKLDYNLMPSNNPTLQSVGLLDQMPLPGIPTSIYLNAGYIPNSFWTKVDDIFVTCHGGNNLAWSYSIKGEVAPVTQKVITLPIAGKEATRKRRIWPKHTPQKEEVGDNDEQS